MDFKVGAASLGTSEEIWNGAAGLPSIAPLDFDALIPAPVPGVEAGGRRRPRCVVVAPHPDDETFGAGGLIAMLARRGFGFTILAVTDGETSHPASPTVSGASMADRRAEEREHALVRLGLRAGSLESSVAEVVRLGVPDGRVKAAETLARRIEARLSGASLCLSTFEGDGHPDHDAAGEAAARACASANVPLLEYLVWAWHWGTPASPEIPWARARALCLSAVARAAKASAILAYESQIAPLSGPPVPPGDEAVLPPEVLARFRRPIEVFLVPEREARR